MGLQLGRKTQVSSRTKASRAKFGELTGPLCLAFPGWKCRWDFLPNSGQTPKTFIDADGREWKLLKDIECLFGVRLTAGGAEAEKIKQMVDAAFLGLERAQALFSQGTVMCKETGTSATIDMATEAVTTETQEEKEMRRAET